MKQRVAIGVEYNGANLHGWQRQASPQVATVQLALENALSKIACHPVKLVCAGRTDAGVHAVGQVAHFDVAVERPDKAWTRGGNAELDPCVRIRWAHTVDDQFHARFTAQWRRYQYWIDDSAVASAIFAGNILHCRYPLDAELMHSAAQQLLGEQDFSAFRAAACDSSTPMRNVQKISVRRVGQRLCVDIQANAFLLHMVRNIVGSLIQVGAGQQKSDWIAQLLAGGDRNLAAATARPDGLYLLQVGYPELFNLPTTQSLSIW
jgi:tRNA pseudouridine38-40 synthase